MNAGFIHPALARKMCLRAQEGLCYLCGKPLPKKVATLDEVVPQVLGGGRWFGNVLAAHRGCNGDKGGRAPTACERLWLSSVNARLRKPPFPQSIWVAQIGYAAMASWLQSSPADVGCAA